MKKSLFIIVGAVLAVLADQACCANLAIPDITFTEQSDGRLIETFNYQQLPTQYIGQWTLAPGSSPTGVQHWTNTATGGQGDIYNAANGGALPLWFEPDNRSLYNFILVGNAYSDSPPPDHLNQRGTDDSTFALGTYNTGTEAGYEQAYIKFVDLGDGAVVPEPSDLALCAIALFVFWLSRRKLMS